MAKKEIIKKVLAVLLVIVLVTIIAEITQEKWFAVFYSTILAFFIDEIKIIYRKIISNASVLSIASIILNVLFVILLVIIRIKAYVVVPDVTGKSYIEAKKDLQTYGLEYSESAEDTATVNSQNPRSGIKVAPGTTVDLIFENGNPLKGLETEPTSQEETDSTTPTKPETEPPYVLPGTIKKFGRYEQNDREWDGAENIEWLALKQEGNEVLIISAFGLELRPYSQGEDTSDWENSSIRSWLNGTFYHTAFSDEEKANIIEKDIFQHKNEDYPSCNQGNNTTDNVFLLSLWEYSEYMYKNGDIDSEYRCGTPSTYVFKKIDSPLSNGKYTWWWLRTSSRDNTTACSVTAYGVKDSGYKDVNTTSGMIRPAMWVNASWWNDLQ